MDIAKFWETYFFKKRNIMSYHNKIEACRNVHCFPMADFDIESLLERADAQLCRYLKMRKHDPAWVLFYYEKENKIMGYSFLHMPKTEEWNDSLPTTSKAARVSSNFVYPEYRGRNILGEITKCQVRYAQKFGLELWCVIENSNKAAMRATQKKADVCRANYLLKIYQRNIVSILTNPFRVYILLGGRRARR